MSIGVSYTGANGIGRSFDVDGVPSSGSMADGILGMQMMSPQSVFSIGLNAPLIGNVPMTRNQAHNMMPMHSMADSLDDGKVKVHSGDTLGFIDEKLAKCGGIVSKGGLLMVEGFDEGKGNESFYSSVGGKVGFHTLDEIDKTDGGTSGFISDVEVELEPQVNSPVASQSIVVKTKTGKISRTRGGRVTSISSGAPHEAFRYEIPTPMFGVRCGFKYEGNDKVHAKGIAWIAFGSEKALATYSGVETVNGKMYGVFKSNEKNPGSVVVISGNDITGGLFGVYPVFNGGTLSSLTFGSNEQLSGIAGSNYAPKTNSVSTTVGCPYGK